MLNAEKLFTNHIKTPMSNLEGTTFIDGWVRIFLEDLKRNSRKGTVANPAEPKPSFPIIAAHVTEDTFSKWNLSKFSVLRQVVISGAIDVKDRIDIDSRLQTLYRDVIASVVGSLDPVKDINRLTLQNAKFSIPDDDSEYAMFELIITTNTVEDLLEWLE